MVKDARSQPPIAIRVVRPYATEDELLLHEASAFSRTGVVLLGAPSRPNGVVLRFEIALTDGSSVMRGEGRVVGFKAPMANEEGALMLRFTRLDVKSKSLLDRAVTIREERRSLAPLPAKPGHAAPPGPAPTRSGAVPSSPSSRPPIAAPASSPPAASPPAPAAAVSVRPPMPSVAPVLAGATQDEDLDDADVEEVADADLEEAEPTVHAPPVAMLEAFAAQAAGPKPPEHAPEPAPPPAEPAPHPVAPPMHTPPTRSPDRAPGPKIAPEHAPPPQRSPEPARRLDAATRASALDRLRERAKKLIELQSMYPVGDRSSGPNGAPRGSMEPGHTPVLGSLVAESEK